jgi:hypothetical protein
MGHVFWIYFQTMLRAWQQGIEGTSMFEVAYCFQDSGGWNADESGFSGGSDFGSGNGKWLPD